MQPSDDISVAMCTCNGAQYLREQLDSIAGQTRLPSELIVCDDASADATLEIAADFARCSPFEVRIYRNQTRLGAAKNFERAIRFCKGQLIALCDQDDWWSSTKLEIQANILSITGAGGVFSNGFLMDGSSRLSSGTLWESVPFHEHGAFCKEAPRDQAISILLRGNVVTGATIMFRSHLRDRLLPFPEEWIHDGWLAWMLVLHSRLVACSDALIHYRVHASQQVSVPGRSLFARLQRVRKTGDREYRSVERQVSALRKYAESHPEVCEADLCRRIRALHEHAAFRAQLKQSRWQTWKEIARRRLEYTAHSNGWRSMLKDALR